MSHTKKLLRKKFTLARKQLSVQQQTLASQQMCALIAKAADFTQAKTVALYWPCNNEISPLPLVDIAYAANKACYLPVMAPNGKRQLLFASYHPLQQLHCNKVGIPEPDLTIAKTIAIQQLDIILLPVVAFDRSGGRLGTGGGYYDASLAILREQTNNVVIPKLIGLGYAIQEVAQLPLDSWDYKLDAIITEQQYIAI